ncbi:SPFH domain-containing protein [Ferrimonas marina]|uniref:SPFH domain / Band 7 family protein n=1 Tax=Ferrimonas marina TaxID=299255 RepID=A0A1M5UME7_9GAMM|nr:SPFH domain-containing protein [Ferrimonas marina]SHH64066.1 SPFH domain / Band 7 family protein [Ferrimonas marina]
MIFIFLGLAFIVAALVVVPQLNALPIIKRSVSAVCVLVGLLMFANTSFLMVPEGSFTTLNRIYMADDLPQGRVMGYEQGKVFKGPQARYITQGFHFMPFVSVLHDTRTHPLTTVNEGQYLSLVAKDGRTLPTGQFMAPEWEMDVNEMLKPEVFLDPSRGNGFKGTQLTVLPPGRYPIHPDLWDVKHGVALTVMTGEVAVVRSNVDTNTDLDCDKLPATNNASDLNAILVPRGCKGVWDEALVPGRYYLNQLAQTATKQTTRAVLWAYVGGYTRRELNLTVADDGTISQEESVQEVPIDPEAAGEAIIVRTKDGWTLAIELYVIAQVHANNAPRVIAGVGSMEAVENRIVTNIARDLLQQKAGVTDAKDMVTAREDLVALLEDAIKPEAAKTGVTVAEVRVGEIVLPPELLLPLRRKQLASSLQDTYAQETLAATERANTENAREIANQQKTIVAAEMNAKAAKIIGEGKKNSMILVAEGQAAQRDVIGKDATVQLMIFERFLEVAKDNPDLIKVPMVNVQGGGDGESLAGMAAVLGSTSNLAQFMKSGKETE